MAGFAIIEDVKLERCPFCGREMQMIDTQRYGYVLIVHADSAQVNCPIWQGIALMANPEEAEYLWNERALPPQ